MNSNWESMDLESLKAKLEEYLNENAVMERRTRGGACDCPLCAPPPHGALVDIHDAITKARNDYDDITPYVIIRSLIAHLMVFIDEDKKFRDLTHVALATNGARPVWCEEGVLTQEEFDQLEDKKRRGESPKPQQRFNEFEDRPADKFDEDDLADINNLAAEEIDDKLADLNDPLDPLYDYYDDNHYEDDDPDDPDVAR